MIGFFLFDGNWVDLIILTLLIFSLFEGWRRGFLGGFFDLLGFLLTFLVALRFYPFAAEFFVVNFSLSLGMAKALGFLSLAIITEMASSFLLGFLHEQIPSQLDQALFNRFLGFITAISQTLIFTAFTLALILALPINGSIKREILSSRIGGTLVGQTQGLERQLNLVFGGAVEETINFFTIKPEGNEKVDLHFTQKELTPDLSSEKSMFLMVDKERRDRGLNELAWDESLAGVARVHAKDMFERGYFSHYTPEGLSPANRLEKAGIRYQMTGENLALAPSVDIAHQGLMNSPGHRANILGGDYNLLGVGVVDGGYFGKMFVQEFTN